MKYRYYFLIGLCSYLFFTLATTPAAKVISLAKTNFTLPAQFYGVEGSIWQGRADSVTVQNQRIDQLQWDLNPLMLLLARVSADVQASVQKQNIVGHVSVNMSGELQGEDIRARLKAEELQQMINMPFGELAGIINVNVETIEWSGTGLPQAIANITWKQAKLTLVETVDLGQVNLDLKPDDKEGLSIAITNKGGVLSLDGSIQLSKKQQYQVKMDFKPAATATDDIKQSLGMFARRQSNGSYRFAQNGNLKQLGL